MSKIKQIFMKQTDLFSILIALFWLKTYFAYLIEFDLGVTGWLQHVILLINPLGLGIILFSMALFSKNKKRRIGLLMGILLAATLLLYSNILYYREFTDFLTMNILVGSNNVSGALIASTLAMMRPWDVLYWIDVIVFLAVMYKVKKGQPVFGSRLDISRKAAGTLLLGILMLVGNLLLAEISRPQLLTRTFDRNYIVKYMGINFFAGYDVYQTAKNSHIKASADESHLEEIVSYAKVNRAEPDPQYFGMAEDRNVIVIAMESIQQFLIDYELEDENGETHEVMPFVNSLFNSEESFSFSNFYHQTGQGKSSDAEILTETSLYGLPQGSAFQTLGSSNTFHATPGILKSKANYTSAAFHGNVGSFWNRSDTYRQFGYDYFFDAEFYDLSGNRALEYGLKDKLFFRDSVEYLEQLPQPFYTKFLTVTHHFPYPLDDQNSGFPIAQTDDSTVNDFFATANYADEAMEEFFTYLKKTGLYENSIFVMYGDHYGISNMRNPHVAPLIGKDPEEWGEFQNAEMQKVPFILHIPGMDEGEVFDMPSGQIDVLPTLLHLLGIETDDYLFMGQDLLSPGHDSSVPLRNGRVITTDYTLIADRIYDNQTGEELSEQFTEAERLELLAERDRARMEMNHSDRLMSMDLLRFYQPESLTQLEPLDYTYSNQMDILQNHPEKQTSVIEKNDGHSTLELYETDAPEIREKMDYIYRPKPGLMERIRN